MYILYIIIIYNYMYIHFFLITYIHKDYKYMRTYNNFNYINILL